MGQDERVEPNSQRSFDRPSQRLIWRFNCERRLIASRFGDKHGNPFPGGVGFDGFTLSPYDRSNYGHALYDVLDVAGQDQGPSNPFDFNMDDDLRDDINDA